MKYPDIVFLSRGVYLCLVFDDVALENLLYIVLQLSFCCLPSCVGKHARVRKLN